jgi:hypothetical protein
MSRTNPSDKLIVYVNVNVARDRRSSIQIALWGQLGQERALYDFVFSVVNNNSQFIQFIDYATGQEVKGAGHGQSSCTDGIVTSKPVSRNGQRYVFVDTPGFNHTSMSDAEVLSIIAEYMVQA